MAEVPFENGVNAFFAGHSFFIPIARSFDRYARGANNSFPDHGFDTVFVSGASAGAPGNLWRNEPVRELIESKFMQEDETVDLFGLTTAGENGGDYEDYVNWIDLALSYNSNTSFLIAHTFLPFGFRERENELYRKNTERTGDRSFRVVVEQLRETYPDTLIFYINYGMTAPIMKDMFFAGNLPDIQTMTPPTPSSGSLEEEEAALFADALIGHAGPMMEDMCALSWMELLYGAKMDDLPSQLLLDWDQASAREIVSEVVDFNARKQYN